MLTKCSFPWNNRLLTIQLNPSVYHGGDDNAESASSSTDKTETVASVTPHQWSGTVCLKLTVKFTK